MTTLWLLLTLTCTGHTNAVCHPTIVEYLTREQCEAARVVPEQRSWFGTRQAFTDPRSVCFPSAR